MPDALCPTVGPRRGLSLQSGNTYMNETTLDPQTEGILLGPSLATGMEGSWKQGPSLSPCGDPAFRLLFPKPTTPCPISWLPALPRTFPLC